MKTSILNVMSAALGLAFFCGPRAGAQVLAPQCGGEGQPACQFWTSEMWANNSGTCDRGLKNSTDDVEFFFGKAGSCQNDTRRTVSHDSSWAAWALREQRNGVQGNLPINAAFTLGTHNSFSNYTDGDRNSLGMNHYYSITDQLQTGARYIRVDPLYYFDQLRTCHASAFSKKLPSQVPDFVPSGITEAQLCQAEAILPSLGLAAFFVPISTPLALAPQPIPEAVVALLIGFDIYGPVGINSRLFAYTLQEIAAWLDNNPGEVIILEMHEANQDHHDLVNQVIQTYLGGRTFTPAELHAMWPVINQWPSIVRLQNWARSHPGQANKQVIILNEAGNKDTDPGTDEAADADPWAFSKSNIENGDTLNLSNCTFGGKDIISSVKPNNTSLWLQAGEGRTGSDWLSKGGFTGARDEDGVAAAVRCGVNMVTLDFWLSLDHAFGNFARPYGPDRRREAAIWSYTEGDFGKGGPAAVSGNTGRWNSTPPSTSLLYACAKPSLGPYAVRTEWTAVFVGDFFGAGYTVDSDNQIAHALGRSDICATSLPGQGYEFAAPVTAYENSLLVSVLQHFGVNTNAWVKYTAVKIPPAVFGGDNPIVYMDRGGKAPGLHLTVDGYPDVDFKVAVSINESKVLDAGAIPAEFTTQFTSLGDGPVALPLFFDSTTVQALPNGTYLATINLFIKGQDSPVNSTTIVLHVMEPTTTSLSPVSNPNCPAGAACLAARVGPICLRPVDQISGGAIGITGGVRFTDTVMDASGNRTTIDLGTLQINKPADQASELDNGNMHAILGCGDNVVCGWVNLPPGQHDITALYGRDSSYNSSASASIDFNNQDPNNATPINIGTMTVNGTVPTAFWTLPALPGYSYQVTASSPFTVSPASGSLANGATLIVSTNPAIQLDPALYSKIVAATANPNTPGAGASKVFSARLMLTVGPQLSADTKAMRFDFQAGLNADAPAPQVIHVKPSVTRPDPIPVSAQAVTENGIDWLRATPGDTIDAPIQVSVNGAGLVAGAHRGTVVISSPVTASTVRLPIVLNISYNGVPTVIDTDPHGLSITVDGKRYTSPAAFFLPAHTNVKVSVPVGHVPLGPGRRAIFTGWDTGENTHGISLFPGGSYTANFRTEMELTTSVTPACAGSVTPVGGWYKENDFVVLHATPADQFQINSFFFDSAAHNPVSQAGLTFDTPKSVSAVFTCPNFGSCNHAGAPFTAASVSPAPNSKGWNNTVPQVTLKASGPGVAVRSVNYAFSGAQAAPSTSVAGDSITVPIAAEGLTSVTYFATDTGANREPANTFLVKVDRTPPTVTPQLTPALNSFGWANQNVSVEFDCSDALSGYSGRPTVRDATSEGISFVNGSCTDDAGNTATASVEIRIEKTPLTVIASLSPATLAATQAPAQVSLIGGFKGGPSGIDPSSVTVTMVDPAGRASTLQSCSIGDSSVRCDVTLSPAAPGTYTFHPKATTKAGNSATATATLTVK